MSPTSSYQAYKQANHTVSKTRQIVMLYDGIIRFLSQAKVAMEEKRIEDRYSLLIKASDIVIGLQSCLDFDHDADVATSLYDYYTGIDARMIALHRSGSADDCSALIEDIKHMRDLWDEIDKNASLPAQPDHDAASQNVASQLAGLEQQASMPIPTRHNESMNGLFVSA